MNKSSEAIPFSEPPWLNGLPSPFYNESHRTWQQYCRAFVSSNLTQYALQWENEGAVPDDVYDIFTKSHMLLPSLPAPLPVDWLKRVGIDQIGPIRIEDFDYTHLSIYVSEMLRSGLNGPASSLTTGIAYGIPPLLKFASKSLQERCVPDILLGKKRICIAITEPDTGSDVANIQTTAVKSEDGQTYIVNGTKKWTTNGSNVAHERKGLRLNNFTGLWSDWATMAVRTGGSGPGGISLLLVPLKRQKGVKMRRMHVSGMKCSGTTYIELSDVEVPMVNLIGKEGDGMKCIMTNFNHERLTISIKVTSQARVALASTFEYCMKREAFGAPLMHQPVVRHRLAKAGGQLEAQWSWVESFVYQMSHLPKEAADIKLGGLISLAKAQAAMVLNECAQCAQLLFGGNGYTQSGQGELIEKIAREVGAARIPGGSEDVMLDLAIRQLYKNYEKASKAHL